jgi:hypothetical protein
MSNLRITKTGLVDDHWNSETKTYDEYRPDNAVILRYLRHDVSIEPGTTLGDVFRMVESYPNLQAFIAQYSWCEGIERFHQEARRPLIKLYDPDEEVDDQPLVATCINQFGSISEEGWLSISADFHGRDEHTNTKFGVGMTPVNELVNLPIELCETVKISTGIERDAEVISWKKGITLLDFLDSIYWEISFYGVDPECRDEMRDEVRQTVADIRCGEVDFHC